MIKPKKIYFGINGQFGDIIIQEPTLRKVIQMNPDAEIIMGAYEKYFGILELYKNYHPQVVDFIKWEKYTTREEENGIGNWPGEKDKKIIEKMNFDKMYDVSPIHKEQDWIHKRHIVNEFGNMYDIEVDNIKIRLNKPVYKKTNKKTVAIALLPSSWSWGGIRSISQEKITNIVSFLKQNGYDVLHLGGPDEPNIKNTIKIQGTYMDSVKAMLSTEFLITCDTGMSWVASAYNHPTIGLYAWGYNPVSKTTTNWQPKNPNAEYLEAYKANQINIYNILDKINKKI
tara:strand:- start:1752 stop:2606 length:855 start_codon:yes stop_codon:yes gene_type:complete